MTIDVDRRRFLTKTAAAGATAGALWVTPSVLGASDAFATGSAAKSCTTPQTLHWTDLASTMPAPSTTGAVNLRTTVAAAGTNPAMDVVITVTPIGTPGPGSYNQYNGTGGVNFAQPDVVLSKSYYLMFMNNSAFSQGYTVKFQFFDKGTSTPRNVYNLKLSLGGLTTAAGGPGNGYVDTAWTDTAFTATKGSGVSGSGTAANPWKGTTGSNNNAWVNLSKTTATTQFSVSYTNGTTSYGVSEWIWINDLTWC